MSLLKLTRPDLPRLKELAERMQPLSPSQAQVLFDVVTHVYLTGESYEQVEVGFLGMGMAQLYDADTGEGSEGGVIVQSRMPGLAAYSSLLEGDVILRFTESPDLLLTNPQRLIDVVRRYRPGDTLHLRIRRQGRELTVPITLSARPGAEIIDSIEAFDEARMKLAEKYWNENFSSLARPAYSCAD